MKRHGEPAFSAVDNACREIFQGIALQKSLGLESPHTLCGRHGCGELHHGLIEKRCAKLQRCAFDGKGVA